jgi:hypothetical protein
VTLKQISISSPSCKLNIFLCKSTPWTELVTRRLQALIPTSPPRTQLPNFYNSLVLYQGQPPSALIQSRTLPNPSSLQALHIRRPYLQSEQQETIQFLKRRDSDRTEKNPKDKERLREKNQTLEKRFKRNRVCGSSRSAWKRGLLHKP